MFFRTFFLLIASITLMLTGCFEAEISSTMMLVPDHAVTGYINLSTGDTLHVVRTTVSHQIRLDSNSALDTLYTGSWSSTTSSVVGSATEGDGDFICNELIESLVGRTYYTYKTGFTVNSHQIIIDGTVIIDSSWQEGVRYDTSMLNGNGEYRVRTYELVQRNAELTLSGIKRRVDVYRRAYGSGIDNDTTIVKVYVEPNNMVVLVEQRREPNDWSKMKNKVASVSEVRSEMTTKRLLNR